MSQIPPLQFSWSGEAMTPIYPRLADRHYVVGARYFLVEHRDRSMASHHHQFAWINEAFKNLPEDLAAHFPNAESLRKRALIDAGFFTQEVIDAGSNIVAIRVAAYARSVDDYAVISVSENIVIIRRAKSQSIAAMGADEFQKSKTAVLETIAGMLGVDPGDLQKAQAA